MRRIVLGLIMSMFLSVSYGQLVDYKKETWDELKNSKLYVVYEEEGTSAYDIALKEAVDLNWKLSQVEYIDYDKFVILQKDKQNFFLISVNLSSEKSFYYTEEQSLVYLVRGYKKGAKKGDIGNFPKLATFQTGNIDSKIYLPLLIKNLNSNINLAVSGEVTSFVEYMKKVKSNTSEIKKKPVYILESDLNTKITSLEDIKKYYKGEVIILSKDELANKIKIGEDINIFYCSRTIGYSYVHIYNAATGIEYYSLYMGINKNMPAGIIPFHLKKWNK